MQESRKLAVRSETFEYKIPSLLLWFYSIIVMLCLLHETYEEHQEVFVSIAMQEADIKHTLGMLESFHLFDIHKQER
jgi:uncharacterized protein YybS (DUF2232 family)